MKKFFITATGTESGKTFITSLLCSELVKSGKKVFAIKPVVSGFKDDGKSDSAIILKSLGMQANDENIKKISPWRFKEELSPDMAARENSRHIDFSAVIKFCKKSMEKKPHWFFSEGAGGIMSPLTHNKTNLDLAKSLEMPIILVSGSYLGSLSHTLTSLAAAEKSCIKVAAVVLNESKGSDIEIPETVKSLKNFTGAEIVAVGRNPSLIKKKEFFLQIMDVLS